jgi:hypothetical protein
MIMEKDKVIQFYEQLNEKLNHPVVLFKIGDYESSINLITFFKNQPNTTRYNVL